MNLYSLFLVLLGSNLSRKVKGLKAETLVGGFPARGGSFKYVVAVMYKEAGVFPDLNPCVGTILSDMYIATVAHCFFNRPSGLLKHRYFYIIAGAHDLRDPRITSQFISVDLVFIHSAYNPLEPDTYAEQGDLAIIRVVPRLQSIRNLSNEFFVTGYGYQNVTLYAVQIDGVEQFVQDGYTDGSLRYARANVLSSDDCEIMLQDNIAPGNMCVKSIRNISNKPTGICLGDSGAPLSHHHYLDGIAINGFLACDENLKPGIYIDVVFYSRFIMDVIQDRITDNMLIMQQQIDNLGNFILSPLVF